MKKGVKKEKNNFKKDIVYSTSEMKRYLGALNETHNEHLKGIREDSIVLNRKINNITETLSEHTKILNEHTKKLDSHTEMIGILMEDTSTIKGGLKKKVDYDDFLSLVRRVQKIESKI